MSSVCISKCINDVARVPMRATYVNLYKWPESDAEFVRSMRSNNKSNMILNSSEMLYGNSISCRQAFLRSYKFSRKESFLGKTRKYFRRAKRKVRFSFRKRKSLVWRKLRAFSCSAFFTILQRLLLLIEA